MWRGDGEILKTETVYVGKSATAPATPIHQNLKFTGWDQSFDSISGDMTVTAQYQRYYTVTFMGHDGTLLKAEDVAEGGAATPPAASQAGGALRRTCVPLFLRERFRFCLRLIPKKR